jgi:hypothetical protein
VKIGFNICIAAFKRLREMPIHITVIGIVIATNGSFGLFTYFRAFSNTSIPVMNKSLRKLKRTIHPKSLQKMVLRFTMKGNNVECPCCGSRYVTFLPAVFKSDRMLPA